MHTVWPYLRQLLAIGINILKQAAADAAVGGGEELGDTGYHPLCVFSLIHGAANLHVHHQQHGWFTLVILHMSFGKKTDCRLVCIIATWLVRQ